MDILDEVFAIDGDTASSEPPSRWMSMIDDRDHVFVSDHCVWNESKTGMLLGSTYHNGSEAFSTNGNFTQYYNESSKTNLLPIPSCVPAAFRDWFPYPCFNAVQVCGNFRVGHLCCLSNFDHCGNIVHSIPQRHQF